MTAMCQCYRVDVCRLAGNVKYCLLLFNNCVVYLSFSNTQCYRLTSDCDQVSIVRPVRVLLTVSVPCISQQCFLVTIAQYQVISTASTRLLVFRHFCTVTMSTIESAY